MVPERRRCRLTWCLLAPPADALPAGVSQVLPVPTDVDMLAGAAGATGPVLPCRRSNVRRIAGVADCLTLDLWVGLMERPVVGEGGYSAEIACALFNFTAAWLDALQ